MAQQPCHGAGAAARRPAPEEDERAGGHLAQRSLLLFEDFDQLLDRDEGFLASVAALLNKSKVLLKPKHCVAKAARFCHLI